MKTACYFVIDTDRYAGNFEREMCAFITGVFGDCGVGERVSNNVCKDKDVKKIECYVGTEVDEHGCWRPCKIYPTPGWANNGLGYEYKIGEGEKQAAVEWATACISQAEAEMRVYADKKHAKKLYDEWIEKSKQPPPAYPAYLSVAIVLDSVPPTKVLNLMKKRAKLFSTLSKNGELESIGVRIDPGQINISGFRLVEEKVVVSETNL